MNFKDMPKKDRIEHAKRSHEARRSPELRLARFNQDAIRKEHETKSISQLAEKYNIAHRTMRRLITGK